MTETGWIKKSDNNAIIVQRTEFHGTVGIDIREYVTRKTYTGSSKNGIRIPVEKWKEFKETLDKVDISEK